MSGWTDRGGEKTGLSGRLNSSRWHEVLRWLPDPQRYHAPSLAVPGSGNSTESSSCWGSRSEAMKMTGPLSTCWTLIEGAAAGDADDRARFAELYMPVIRTYLEARWLFFLQQQTAYEVTV